MENLTHEACIMITAVHKKPLEHAHLHSADPHTPVVYEGPATKSGLRNPPIENLIIGLSCGADQCGFN